MRRQQKRRAALTESEKDSQNAVNVEDQNNDSGSETEAEKNSENALIVDKKNNDSAIETEADGELTYLQAKARDMRSRKSAKNRIKEQKNQDLEDKERKD